MFIHHKLAVIPGLEYSFLVALDSSSEEAVLSAEVFFLRKFTIWVSYILKQLKKKSLSFPLKS